MKANPILIIYEEHSFIVGQDTFIDSTVENDNAVVFEDNEETGYFFALNRQKKLIILDALHIYDVSNVVDKHRPSVLKILWTEDLMRAFLSINNYYHAVFDFQNKAGYCRNGFPPSNDTWAATSERILTNDLIDKLSKES